MKKYLFLTLTLPLLISSCKEKDLTGDNPAPDPENIILETSILYNGDGFNKDSVIINDLGYQFYITSVELVMSDFYFYDINTDDTVVESLSPFIVSNTEPEQKLVVMKSGGYSGYYGLRLGLDSISSVMTNPATISDKSDLQNSDVFRSDNNGVDQVIIKGRMLDPDDPTDSIGNIPLEYRLGTYLLSRTMESTQQNFSLKANSRVQFVMVVDLGPVFEALDMKMLPKITSDITNPVEMQVAAIMTDSLKINLY